MLLSDCIADYLRHIQFERGLTTKTVKGYQAWLHNFESWMTANGYPEPHLCDFTAPVLKRYFYHMAGRGLRPRTLWSVFHPLRGLGEYLMAQTALTENPAKTITLPKKDAAIRKTVSDPEITLLLEACDRIRGAKNISLSRAVLSVLVFCGLRRQELLDLKVGDINLEDRSLLVRSGKGQKSRMVFLCNDAIDALRDWLAMRRKDTNHDWLWAYDRNRRLHDNGLRNIVEDLKAAAGLAHKSEIVPHALRHACATRLLRQGADLKSISTWLGHTMLQTTAQYLHTNEEQLRAIAALTALPQSREDKPVRNQNERAQAPRRLHREERGKLRG